MNNTIQSLNSEESAILALLSKTPAKEFTIDGISKALKLSYATTHRKIESLVEQGLVSKSMYGMASRITLNLQSEKTISVLALLEADKTAFFIGKLRGNVKTSITEIIKDIENIAELKSILVFGSYAKNKQTKDSDLDLIVIFEPSKFIGKNHEAYLNEIKSAMRSIIKTNELRSGLKLMPIIITVEEHKEMIINNQENVAKETLLNHIILKGSNEYWREIAKCYPKQR